MRFKWVFLMVVVVLVLMAASSIWVRQDAPPMADVALSPGGQEDASGDAAESGESEPMPLASRPGTFDAANPTHNEVASSINAVQKPPATPTRKSGEPLNPPPIPERFPEPAAPQMGWAEARYDIDGRVVTPGNQFGQMALVHVAPGARISATLKWPKAVTGSAVALEVVDGGRLEGGRLSALARVDERGEISFRFTANRQPGKCQVVARSGMDETALCFWVAEESAKNIPAGL